MRHPNEKFRFKPGFFVRMKFYIFICICIKYSEIFCANRIILIINQFMHTFLIIKTNYRSKNNSIPNESFGIEYNTYHTDYVITLYGYFLSINVIIFLGATLRVIAPLTTDTLSSTVSARFVSAASEKTFSSSLIIAVCSLSDTL